MISYICHSILSLTGYNPPKVLNFENNKLDYNSIRLPMFYYERQRSLHSEKIVCSKSTSSSTSHSKGRKIFYSPREHENILSVLRSNKNDVVYRAAVLSVYFDPRVETTDKTSSIRFIGDFMKNVIVIKLGDPSKKIYYIQIYNLHYMEKCPTIDSYYCMLELTVSKQTIYSFVRQLHKLNSHVQLCPSDILDCTVFYYNTKPNSITVNKSKIVITSTITFYSNFRDDIHALFETCLGFLNCTNNLMSFNFIEDIFHNFSDYDLTPAEYYGSTVMNLAMREFSHLKIRKEIEKKNSDKLYLTVENLQL